MPDIMHHFQTNPFRFSGENSILEDKDLGICADIASVLTPGSHVCALKTFQGCPYTNTGFQFDVLIDGEALRAEKWEWLPNAMRRVGGTKDFAAESVAAVVPGIRAAVMHLTVTNKTPFCKTVPLQIPFRGAARKESAWMFQIPAPSVCRREDFSAGNGVLLSETGEAAFAVTASIADLALFRRAYLWETVISLKSGESMGIFFSFHVGEKNACKNEAHAAVGRWQEMLDASFEWLSKETRRIHDCLPRLSSSDAALDNLYYRSLVTYILCRWENPELCAVPYFSTGSINGGCMCSYLWDYCGGLMLHPVYDSAGNKAQLKAYLKNDLTKSYALNPVTGGAVGPWYQINQEKIICMVYYHVLFTGDKEFLFERAGGKTVLEWMMYHAYVCDDPEGDVQLYDYGTGGDDHLEIAPRGNGPYNGIMPDLNARRYMNYMRVYELTALAGQPDERLRLRAAALREKLKALWNEEAKWYDFIGADGKRDLRYTVQMFKFLNSPVIGEREREGLISHLNDAEFLSKFGLHSMSKLDPQYDQDDIDNGGGGICTHFTMQICAQLYETGFDALATDILKRVYWWGERMPYMGDSCAANMIANREDTPLQGDISSVSCAQMMIFYIFGICADFSGGITVSPVRNRPAKNMRLANIRLCGKKFDVEICGEGFSVMSNGNLQKAQIGESIRIG